MKVVLLQSPFFKTAGSHNDRPSLELAYASRFLEDAGIEHVLVNADYLGSTKHVPWSVLFDPVNQQLFRDAVDGRSPLLDQTIELVMQYSPEIVVIAAGDSCLPTKDFGSPYIASRISMKLRKYGVRTIGIGPMFLKDERTFRNAFDDLFLGLVNRSLIDLIVGEKPDVMTGWPIGAIPQFSYTEPFRISDYVMTNFGCYAGCTFCMAPLTTSGAVQFQQLSVVAQDMIGRAATLGTKKLYIGDMIFPMNPRRLRTLAEMLEGGGFEFTCESRTDLIRPEMLEVMAKIGVKTVKLGLESTDDETLIAMNKHQTLDRETEAIRLLRAGGFKIVGYLILGAFYPNVGAMQRSIERAASLDVDHFVVNVAAYDSFCWNDDRRYDSHFSMSGASRQGVPEDIVRQALILQENRQNPTVDLLLNRESIANVGRTTA